MFIGPDGRTTSAQTAIPTGEPDGGGEFKFLPRDEITDEQRREIQAEIRKNIERLEREEGTSARSARGYRLLVARDKSAGRD